jgi:hypothetical protein
MDTQAPRSSRVAMADGKHQRSLAVAREEGAVLVIVMVFCMIFVILGLSMFWLSASQIRSTETERTDVKAFNVAEAGVDAGLLALKGSWPTATDDHAAVTTDDLKTSLQTVNPTLWDPSRSDASEFLQVAIYDNSEDGATVTEPPAEAKRALYDANNDGMMFVDASANVDDDRHRILVLAEKKKWTLTFPEGTALFADAVASNGQGFGIEIEEGGPPIYYYVNDSLGKGIDPGDGVSTLPTSTTFEAVFTDAMRRALEGMAKNQGHYYTDDDEAETFLKKGPETTGGSVVYVDSPDAIDISGNTQIGSEEEPVIVVIDTPDGSCNVWDMTGNADFYGVLVTIGDSQLKGTCSVHGAMYCQGTLDNKGTGSSAELYYNQKVIMNLNRQYIISVNIVPNTWEEYTLPKT